MNLRPHDIAFGGDVRTGNPADGERLTASLLLNAFRRRWPTMLGVCLLCLAAAAGYISAVKPQFTATSMLLIDTKMQPPQPAHIGQTNADVVIDAGVIESQIEILRSNAIAFDVVDRLRLAHDPEFVPPGPSLVARLVGAASDLLGLKAAAGKQPDPRRTAVSSLAEKVRIARSGRSFLAEISATTLDPEKSARIANAVAESYIQDQLGNRMEASQRTIEWMQRRLAEVKIRADAADRDLRAFRAEHPCLGPRCPSAAADGAPPRTDAGDASDRIPQQGSPTDGTDGREQALVRAATTARNTYEALENRVGRVSSFIQQEALPVTEARVVNTALPPSTKSAPKTGVVLLLGLVGGLVAGAAAAGLREMSDRRLRGSDQITRMLNQNYLGAIPPVSGRHASFAGPGSIAGRPGGRAARLPMLTSGRGKSPAVLDALVCAKFLVDQGQERGRCAIVGIVSAGEGEGKSTLAANFGALIAQMGARVLVVDADLQSGDLSRSLGRGTGAGLADAARGPLRLADCTVPTEYGFDLLPAFSEAPPEHALVILASQPLRDLMAEAVGAYDYVLIDIPGVLNGMEARPLLREIDTCIVTATAGRTTVDDLQRVFATCPTIEESAVGVILSRSRHPARHVIVRMPRLLKVAA